MPGCQIKSLTNLIGSSHPKYSKSKNLNFLFLSIKRPRKSVFKYEDSEGKLQEAHLDGMMSRICQHEYDHILGRNFVEHVSKFKLKRAEEKAKKLINQMRKSQA